MQFRLYVGRYLVLVPVLVGMEQLFYVSPPERFQSTQSLPSYSIELQYNNNNTTIIKIITCKIYFEVLVFTFLHVPRSSNLS